MMNYLRTDYGEIYLDNGILFFTYFNIPTFNLTTAQKIVEDRIMLQKEMAYPILCDMRAINYPDIEARNYLAIQGSLLIKAVAYLVAVEFPNHLVEFFMEVNPPKVPTQVFKDREKALSFLQPYK